MRREVVICIIFLYSALNHNKEDIRHDVWLNRPFFEWTSESMGIMNPNDPLPNNENFLVASKLENEKQNMTYQSLVDKPKDKKNPHNNDWAKYWVAPLADQKI